MKRNQLNIDFGKVERDKGIAVAVAHADKVLDGWSKDAYDAFLQWLSHQNKGHQFMIEDFRAAVSMTLEDPPSRRAFGFLPVRAAKEGLIVRVGYTQVKNTNAHCANASVWKIN